MCVGDFPTHQSVRSDALAADVDDKPGFPRPQFGTSPTPAPGPAVNV
jgi:hypothetical protein